MKNFKTALILLMFLGIGSFLLMSAEATKAKKLRHVVAFKFKSDVSLAQMEKISKDFHALKGKVPQIIEFEGGAHLKFPETIKEGEAFTHCFIVTVKDEKDLAAYGAHPHHQAFSDSVLPLVNEVMVVDYWIE